MVQTFPDRHLQLLDIDILTTKDKTKVEKKGDCDYKSNQIKNPCDMDIVYHWHSFEADVRRELDAVSSVCVLIRQFLKVQLISKNKVYEIVVMLHYFFVAIHYFFT